MKAWKRFGGCSPIAAQRTKAATTDLKMSSSIRRAARPNWRCSSAATRIVRYAARLTSATAASRRG